MAVPKLIGTKEVNRGAPCDVLDRLCVFAAGSRTVSPVAAEGYLIKQADVSSISVKGWYAGAQIGTTQTPTVSSVIYDTLQTAGGWENIVDGGNAHYQIPASLLDVASPEPVVVRVQIELTMADATLIEWWWDVTVKPSAG